MTAERESSEGLVLINTGDGKGKTTAALGTVLRAVGYGHRALIVQFIKGSWAYGEMKSIKRLEPEVEFHRMGGDLSASSTTTCRAKRTYKAAQEALAFAVDRMTSGDYQLVLLDEIFVAVKLELLTVADLHKVLDARPRGTTLILTGRGAPPEIIERGDTVTEMKEIKHAYQRGILARRGVDY
ncbi:MAG: cob(I)yrinic acid a,c-diamide adenosyltransferase [bacterium]|nr:cob(I)yrinic acid a,c-diamide adenosyltransferase [bacterium]